MTGEIDLQKLERMFDEAAKSLVEKMAETAKKKAESMEPAETKEIEIDVS